MVFAGTSIIWVGRNGFEIMNNIVNTFFFESEGNKFFFLILNGFLLLELGEEIFNW